ncbi:MAG: tRNA dihydrouridine synthase DusB [Gammaproteobacteria bacterium]|nr:tRNA dihydrouridine synthase DusB [Gammaproteobacteria bacterium]
MRIGNYSLANALIVAPMAGVTDRPFRQLCRKLGASLAVSEMVASNRRLRDTPQSRRRRDHAGETEPRSVQIVGADPAQMADAARFNVDHGAQIIDINMGCPARKVCKKLAGSALLRDEKLVEQILHTVVEAVDVPVTLKMRTGWDLEHRNGVLIARIAEDCGIQAIAVHGRTRACRYRGEAEFQTIAQIKKAVSVPVLANGDINTPEKSLEVLRVTNADGLMIGRAAQGRPWIFRELSNYLLHGNTGTPLEKNELRDIMIGHLGDLHRFYGERSGVRVARKHLIWYCKHLVNADDFRHQIVRVECAQEQLRLTREYFNREGGGISIAA